MLHKLVQTCLDLFKLVQTCLKISIQMTSVFSHFHKNSEHMLFSTRTLTILLKKSSSKTTKKNYQTKQILLLIPPFHPSIIPNNFNATIYLLFSKISTFYLRFYYNLNEKRKKFGNIYQQITIFFSQSSFIYYKAVARLFQQYCLIEFLEGKKKVI